MMNKEENFLPNFLIAGAAKSGTTSIYHYLSQHPNVFFPEIKEPQFWALKEDEFEYKGFDTMPLTVTNLTSYVNLYKEASIGQLLGDASPSTLYRSKVSVKNIKEKYRYPKEVKIIIILRNPMERAWSQYWHFRKYNNEFLSFEEAISSSIIEDRIANGWNYFYDYIGFGKYATQVKDFQSNFKNVKIILFEDLKEDTNLVIKDVLTFLDLPKYDIETQTKYNLSGKPKDTFYGKLWKYLYNDFPLRKNISGLVPKTVKVKFNNLLGKRALDKQIIPNEMYNYLLDIYKEDIQDLEHVINRDLSNWIQKR